MKVQFSPSAKPFVFVPTVAAGKNSVLPGSELTVAAEQTFSTHEPNTVSVPSSQLNLGLPS